MKNNFNRKSFVWITAALAAALLLIFELRHPLSTQAAPKQQAQTLAHSGSALAETDPVALATSAPYRDGLYQRKLTQERGEALHVSAGRWSFQADRDAYTAGYLEAPSGSALASSRNPAN
jgi:hypothetical protein